MPETAQLTSMFSEFGFDQPHSRDDLLELDVGGVEGGTVGSRWDAYAPPKSSQESRQPRQRSKKLLSSWTESPSSRFSPFLRSAVVHVGDNVCKVKKRASRA